MVVQRIVVPGEELGSIEEGEAGEGTHEESGLVKAQIIGSLEFDKAKKVFRVVPIKDKAPIPRMGEEVIARVISVQNKLATLEIIRAGERVLRRTFTGLLYYKRLDGSAVKDLRNHIRPGDTIRGKIIYNRSPIQISMSDGKCGVVLANCSICGYKLEKTDRVNFLICRNCGSRESRLVAPDYGEPEW